MLGQGPSVLGGTLDLSTPVTQSSNVGAYAITPSGLMSGNYAIAYHAGAFMVTKTPLTVSAADKSKVYGSANPPFTASYAGFVLGQGTATLGGSLIFSTPATSASHVGNYAITPSGLTSGNYAIAFMNGALAITPKALIITAENKTKQYSDALPAFTVVYGGLVNGDAPASLSGSLAFSTPATPLSAPGGYTITPSGLNSPDYSISYVNGALAVVQEDARATYTGTLFAGTRSATDGSATVTLAATIQDITAVLGDPAYDPYAGDITKATVTFVNRDNNNSVIAANVPIGLVNAADPKTGAAVYNWSVNIGTADSAQYTIGVIVNGHYTRNKSADNTVVTVSKLLNGSITGGGYLVLAHPSGLKAGDASTRNNFGFNVKNAANGPKGNINTIVRRTEQDGVLHVYQIKGNSMTSLATQPNTSGGTATFNGKASIQDITNPLAPVSVDGNATLQVKITDRGEPGVSDSIAITVWNKTGGVWIASEWNGTQTLEQTLGGGNLVVR